MVRFCSVCKISTSIHAVHKIHGTRPIYKSNSVTWLILQTLENITITSNFIIYYCVYYFILYNILYILCNIQCKSNKLIIKVPCCMSPEIVFTVDRIRHSHRTRSGLRVMMMTFKHVQLTYLIAWMEMTAKILHCLAAWRFVSFEINYSHMRLCSSTFTVHQDCKSVNSLVIAVPTFAFSIEFLTGPS